MIIFYAGNMLSKFGSTKTGVETLSFQLDSIGYSVIAVSEKKNKTLRLLDMVFQLVKNRRIVKVVLIDTYSMSAFWYTVALVFICKLYQLPYFPVLRGGGLLRRIVQNRTLSDYVFSGSRMNIAPSPRFVQIFKKYGYKVMCIPNNIDVSQYRFKDRNQFSFNLLWVRSFHTIYNPQLAIDLVRQLLDNGYEARLCMVGPDKDGTMEACKLYARDIGVEKNVQFTGLLSKSDWHKLAEDYDVFINTTNVDNTPVSIIEAMALGIPVLSTNVGGIPHLLSHGQDALLVPPRNVDEFLKAVVEICQFPNETKKRVLAARKKAESYDWEVVKNDWISLFNQVQ